MPNIHLLSTIWEEEAGVLSWARVHATVTVLAAVTCLCYLTWHNHALPDAVTLGALATFGTFPYGVNKITTAFTKS